MIDCGEANNYSCDGFTWAPRVALNGSDRFWDATANFAGVVTGSDELGGWERFAQALLISNEAMYLD